MSENTLSMFDHLHLSKKGDLLKQIHVQASTVTVMLQQITETTEIGEIQIRKGQKFPFLLSWKKCPLLSGQKIVLYRHSQTERI